MRFTAEKLGFSVSWSNPDLTARLTVTPFSARTATLVLDGAEMALPGPSFFDAGTLMCPAESFLRQLGAMVSWYADSRTLAVERRGIQILAIADQLRVTVNGQNEELGRGVGIINDLPYVPAQFYATTLRYGYRWDEATATASLTTDPLTALSETLISDQGWRDATMHAIPGGGLMVIARKKAPGRDIVFAVSGDAGENWQVQALPEPFGVNGGEFDGFALSPTELFCNAGIIVNAANITAMPIWRAQAGGQWLQATAPGSDRRATRRFATSVVAAGGVVYAAGYETIDSAMIGQLWRSTDRGVTWTPLCDGNGRIRGGGAAAIAPGAVTGGLPQPVGGALGTLAQPDEQPLRMYTVAAAAPDGTVWGWAWSDLLRIEPGGAAGFVPFPTEDLQEIVDIRAPTNTHVYVLALRGAQWDRRHYFISASSDRGATWQSYSLGQPHSVPLLIDFASAHASVMARDNTRGGGTEAWEMTITRSDWRTSYDSMALPTHNVLDVLMSGPDRACVLAHKVNPDLLYILRWDVLP